MPELWIFLYVLAVMLIGIGILLIVIVQENSHNLDEWWRAIDDKRRKKSASVGNLKAGGEVSGEDSRQP